MTKSEESVRWLRHDADIILEVRARSAERLFSIAADELVAMMAGKKRPDPDDRRKVILEGSDSESLLVAWLNEIVYIVTSGSFTPSGPPEVSLGPGRLEAAIPGSAPAGGSAVLLREVKAATYHGLEVRENGGVWSARILFDV